MPHVILNPEQEDRNLTIAILRALQIGNAGFQSLKRRTEALRKGLPVAPAPLLEHITKLSAEGLVTTVANPDYTGNATEGAVPRRLYSITFQGERYLGQKESAP